MQCYNCTNGRREGNGVPTDRARRQRGNSEREFERLYLESYSLVYNFVSYRMADPTAAEDVVAEAFMLAARSFHRFDPARSKFSTWVIAIAKNCVSSYFRKVRPTVALDEASPKVIAISGGQDEVDDKQLVLQLLSVLKEDERELVVLKYRDGLRNVDIAAKLDMNASTVATKLAAALSKMRAAYGKSQE